MADPTTLREAAIDSYHGVHTDAAKAALIELIGDPFGFVAALGQEYQNIGPTFSLSVFTDGDLHLGVQIYTDGRDPKIGFMELGADGKWTFTQMILSLPQMGQVVGTVDTDPNA